MCVGQYSYLRSKMLCGNYILHLGRNIVYTFFGCCTWYYNMPTAWAVDEVSITQSYFMTEAGRPGGRPLQFRYWYNKIGGAPITNTGTPPIIFLSLFSGSFFAYFFLEKSRRISPSADGAWGSTSDSPTPQGCSALCGERLRALPLEPTNFLKKVWSKT